jgi:putative acetyltransferase
MTNNKMDDISIRLIEQADNTALAMIIRNALTEFNANKPGTVYFDDSTDHLYELFQQQQGVYHVAVFNELVVGGAGIMPELIAAIPMYEQFGFTYLSGPLGNSGHTGCDIWMIKLL